MCLYGADVRGLAPEWLVDMQGIGRNKLSYWYIFRTVPLGWIAGTIGGVLFARRANTA